MTQSALLSNSYFKLARDISEKKEFQEEYGLLYKIGVLYDLWSIAGTEHRDIIKTSLDLSIEIINCDKKYEDIIIRLLESAFIFANLDSNNELNSYEVIEEMDGLRNKAYRIAISIYFYGKYLQHSWDISNTLFNNNIIIYRLFTRLWILTKARNEKIEDVDVFSMDLQGKIEATRKEIRNRFCIGDELLLWKKFKNDEIFFSDFQKTVMEKLIWNFETSESIAISAPTSAGKTFVLKRYIVYKLVESVEKDKPINIAFIVPSKALINELKIDFSQLFSDYWIDDVCFIHTHITWSDYKENYKSFSNLFILTQERLNYFYSDIESWIKFDILIVDEAHKVGYGYRWTLLSYIIAKLKKDHPYTQIVLLAPLINKLHKFKGEFWLHSLVEKFSNFWLVAKNFIKVDGIREEKWWRTHFYLDLWNEYPWKKLLLFKLKKHLGESVSNPSQNKALSYLAKNFGENATQSIIFRYWPGNVKSQAEALFNSLQEPDRADSVIDLWNYLTDILPKDFDLKEYLKRGIGYHNWALPISIKSNIEKLFREWKLQYLCANSTLLEGVNLPAKNIFISTDWKAPSISRLDLKNLVGRSWRLNEHLSGNIFLVNCQEFEDKLPTTEPWLENVEHNISNTLNDSESTKILGNTKLDRFMIYLSPGTKFNEPLLLSDELAKTERVDFEYMTGYLISCHIEETQNYKDQSSQQTIAYTEPNLYNIEEGKYLMKYIKKVGEFIYENSDLKLEKLAKLQDLVKNIYSDIFNETKWDLPFLNLIKRNIFLDPRKQLDFYIRVSNGNDDFIKNNIWEYSEIIGLLTSKTQLYTDYISVWEKNISIYLTEKSEKLKGLIREVQKWFVQRYFYIQEDEQCIISFSWESYVWQMESMILRWINSVPLRSILWKNKKYYISNLQTLTKEVHFNYLNAFSIYFEIANLGYKKYLMNLGFDIDEIDNIKGLDTNFIYYLELWTYLPNLVYLIWKWVSRESAIWLMQNKYINSFPGIWNLSETYFLSNRERLLNLLNLNKKTVIRDELEKFIYS
ncbi:MAG: DEAD/DEAH box helicase protein [uncultured bacterium (gcode 4)]|uniref:DEAD/DEAH box helicase protein n=1 Tax=uncultured bacterium (gcode 4) TaxID=1234023 RepID=K1YPB2_9BACT|nr:MAG: DEAD/DEAH box helicase protein [uncultured bacterium (gcode 4)]